MCRSLITLKALTYAPTGGIVAAATTSLPEWPGGVRNWDYRYTWVRDAAFTVYALMRLGYTEEAHAFGEFIQARAQEDSQSEGPLSVMYGIDGRHDLPEFTLDHLDGYRGSKPVRIGNGAAGQYQADMFGLVLELTWRWSTRPRMSCSGCWVTTTTARSIAATGRSARSGRRRPNGRPEPRVEPSTPGSWRLWPD